MMVTTKKKRPVVHGDPAKDDDMSRLATHLQSIATHYYLKNIDESTLQKLKRGLTHLLAEVDYAISVRLDQRFGGVKSAVKAAKASNETR